jgi:hypothetical protein
LIPASRSPPTAVPVCSALQIKQTSAGADVLAAMFMDAGDRSATGLLAVVFVFHQQKLISLP